MANLRGAGKLLTEFAQICTEKQFADLCIKDASYLEKEYVYLSSTQLRGELCGGVIKGELPKGSIAIIPYDVSAAYIAFLLTSLPCQYMLFEQKINVKAKMKITKKAVSKLTAYEVEQSSENMYGLAQLLKEQIYTLYKDNKEDMSFYHFYFLLADLCNILALELYAHPLFEKMEIFILENWKKLIAEYESTKDSKVLFDGLINSESALRNQIMKVHMFENNFDEYINKNTDGLEDK